MGSPPTIDARALTTLCGQWGIRRLSLFGSVLRSDFRADSDVDVLVEFEEGQTPSLLGMERLRHDLSILFGGRPVDLFTEQSLGPHIRDQVLSTAVVQYAA